jgi:hypothetical protein
MGNNPYYYPPWFVWIFVPLVHLPFNLGRAIWMAFNLILWDTSLLSLSLMVRWPRKGWRRYSFFILCTLGFAWITWRYEQAGILVLAILLGAIASISAQRWYLAGFLLALLLIKPNVTLVIVLAILLWLIKRARWKPVAVFTASFFILMVVSTWLTPDWFQPFFEPGFGNGLSLALDGPNRIVAHRLNTTVLDWLATFGLSHSAIPYIYGILVVIGFIALFLVIWKSDSLLLCVTAALLVSYGLTPYALQYDYPPLIIVLFWVSSLKLESAAHMATSALLVIFIFSVNIWQQDISWGYWIVVGLLALTTWVFLDRSAAHPKVPLPHHSARI